MSFNNDDPYRFLNKPAEGYWKKGDQDPEHGKPHRHTRAKIKLLMPYLDAGDVERVLLKVAERRPEDVLAVMCEIMDDADEILGAKE